MYLFCHSSAVALDLSTSWLCWWLVVSHSSTLYSHSFLTFSLPLCVAFLFLRTVYFPLFVYLRPPSPSPSLPTPVSPGLPLPACLSLSACMTKPLPTFSIPPLTSPYVSPALTTSLRVGEGSYWAKVVLTLGWSRAEPLWKSPGGCSLQPSPTLCSLPHLPPPMACSPLPGLFSSSLWTVCRQSCFEFSRSKLTRKVWGKEIAVFQMPFAPFRPTSLLPRSIYGWVVHWFFAVPRSCILQSWALS